MTQIVHEPTCDIVALTVDRAGGKPERVVLHIREVVRCEPADAARLLHVGRREIQPVGALDPILAHDAPEAIQRIAHLRERTVRPLFEQRIEVALVEQAALAEGAHTPVDAARLIQIEGGPADVVDQTAEPARLKRRE